MSASAEKDRSPDHDARKLTNKVTPQPGVGTATAVRINSRGNQPALSRLEIGPPEAGQVQLRMRAGALNFADLLMIEGKYQDTPPYPFTAGIEGAGEVVALGAGVTGLAVGDRVAVWARGTLATVANFDAGDCLPIPDAMSFAEAAGFQVAYGTSHLALTGRGALRAGETLAVLGAAGGVGLTAVEIGAALGARVIAVARGAERLAVAEAAGATDLIDSATTDDLRAALRELGGVDVVYDALGDRPGEQAFGALKRGGRFLAIGFAAGQPPALPLNHALVKNIAIHGFYWGGYRELDPTALRDSLRALTDLYAAGKLHPHVGAALPIESVAEAYALLRDRRSTGKVVVTL